MQQNDAKKARKISKKILVTFSFLFGHARHGKNAPCHRHGHLLGELSGLPRPPHRQAAPLLRAVVAPAQRPAAAGAATAAADADTDAAAAAAHASPAAGEAEARAGGVVRRGLDGLGRVVADAAVRHRGRARLGWVPRLRRRLRAAQDPLRGRAAAGQHQGRGARAGGRSSQRNTVLRDASRRRRRAAAGGPGGDRPSGAGGRRRRRDVRGHVRRWQAAAGAGDGVEAVHEGDVRGRGVRAAVHEGRRQAAGGRPAGARLRRRRRRLRRRRRAGPARGDARVHRGGRQGVHRAGVIRRDAARADRSASCTLSVLPSDILEIMQLPGDNFAAKFLESF